MNIDELIEAHDLLHLAICEKENGEERDGILLDGLRMLEKFTGCIYELNETGEVYLDSDNISQACSLIRLGYAKIDPADPSKVIKNEKKVVASDETAFPWEKQQQPRTPR